MNKKKITIIAPFLLVLLALTTVVAIAQERAPDQPSEAGSYVFGTSYQGRLEDASGPYDGTCNMRFELFGSISGSDQIGSTQVIPGVIVSDGYFLIDQLNFGPAAFNGETRYLAISVECPTGSGYVSLTPRQALLAAPSAMSLPGFYTIWHSTSPSIIGGYSGNQLGTSINGGTISGGGYEGFENKVEDDYGTIGGGAGNLVTGGWANTVGGGWGNTANGSINTVAGGEGNIADSPQFAFIGGGNRNSNSGEGATISGGITNTIASGANFATIGGGGYNQISADLSPVPVASTIAGGYANYVAGSVNTISGGAHNEIYAQDNAFIGGGFYNTSSGSFSALTGGVTNTIEITGTYGVIGGGQGNLVSGVGAAIPGGIENEASGDHSFAAGTYAKATHEGSFVWSDSRHDVPFESLRDHQFRIQAAGGTQITDGNGNWLEFMWGDTIRSSAGASLSRGGTWTNASDVNLKQNFAPVDNLAVLDKLASIPSQTWNYISEGAEIRHMGPTAQDFHAAFGLGETETAISTIDADGVSLAAIQGLYELTQDQASTIESLQADNTELLARLEILEKENQDQGFPWIWLLSGGTLLFLLVDKVLSRRRRNAFGNLSG